MGRSRCLSVFHRRLTQKRGSDGPFTQLGLPVGFAYVLLMEGMMLFYSMKIGKSASEL